MLFFNYVVMIWDLDIASQMKLLIVFLSGHDYHHQLLYFGNAISRKGESTFHVGATALKPAD